LTTDTTSRAKGQFKIQWNFIDSRCRDNSLTIAAPTTSYDFSYNFDNSVVSKVVADWTLSVSWCPHTFTCAVVNPGTTSMDFCTNVMENTSGWSTYINGNLYASKFDFQSRDVQAYAMGAYALTITGSINEQVTKTATKVITITLIDPCPTDTLTVTETTITPFYTYFNPVPATTITRNVNDASQSLAYVGNYQTAAQATSRDTEIPTPVAHCGPYVYAITNTDGSALNALFSWDPLSGLSLLYSITNPNLSGTFTLKLDVTSSIAGYSNLVYTKNPLLTVTIVDTCTLTAVVQPDLTFVIGKDLARTSYLTQFTTPFSGCATYTTYTLTYSDANAANVVTFDASTMKLVLDYTGSDLSGDFGIDVATPSKTYVLTLTATYTYTGIVTTLTATDTFNLVLNHACIDPSYSWINVPVLDDQYYMLYQSASSIDLKTHFAHSLGSFCGDVILTVKAISPLPIPQRLKNAALEIGATTYPITKNDFILSVYA